MFTIIRVGIWATFVLAGVLAFAYLFYIRRAEAHHRVNPARLVIPAIFSVALYLALYLLPFVEQSDIVKLYPAALATPLQRVVEILFGHFAQQPVTWYLYYGVITLALFICYLYAIYITLNAAPQVDARLVFGIAAVFGLALVAFLPVISRDITFYMSDGRLVDRYQQNPFDVTPGQFPSDPFAVYLPTSFLQDVNVYGPVWVYIETLVSKVSGDNALLSFLLFKLIALAAYLLVGLCIYRILGEIAPDRQLLGTLVYLWNPLILVSAPGAGHNDIVMLLFAMAGLYLFVIGKPEVGILAVALSALVKYVSAIFLPSMVLLCLQARRTPLTLRVLRTSGSLLLVLPLGIGLYLPFVQGGQSLLQNLLRVSAQSEWAPGIPMAVGTLVPRAIGMLTHSPDLVSPDTAQKIVEILLGLAVVGYVLWESWRARSNADLPAIWARSMLLFFVLIISWKPWYAVWPVTTAAVLPWKSKVFQGVLLLSLVMGTYLTGTVASG